jgi:hypothetical protein
MRTLILAIVAIAALGLSTAASAQAGAGVGVNHGDMGVDLDSSGNRYDAAIMMLKKKMDRQTREDGGKLTPEHAASLQAELDKVNLQFGVKAKPARRASFGHHEPAPVTGSPS